MTETSSAPEPPARARHMAARAVQAGIRQLYEGRTDAARVFASAALAYDPTCADAFNLLGAIVERQGSGVACALEAERLYRAALALEPRHAAASENLTRLTRTLWPSSSARVDLTSVGAP